MKKLLVLAACWVAALLSPATADEFPSRPVRVVVGFAPGGATDITARLIAQSLTELWGQQVVIENRPGAATVIASTLVSQSPPDGYTLFHNSNSHVVAKLIAKSVSYDPVKDFTAISKVFYTPNVLLVNNAQPMKTLAELLTFAHANPGKLSYGNPGFGTITHLGGELFAQMANVKLVAVAYRGGALSMQALIAGELPMTFNTLPEVISQIQGGAVRPLGVTTTKRAPSLPDLPAIGETLKGFDVEVWQAWLGPPNMPAPLVKKINADLVKVLAAPQLRQRFAELGAVPDSSTPEAMAALLQTELDRWTHVVQVAGIKPE